MKRAWRLAGQDFKMACNLGEWNIFNVEDEEYNQLSTIDGFIEQDTNAVPLG